VKGHCDVVECLLSSGGEINLRNENGHSPLIAASCKGEYDVVKCLLSSGADINLCVLSLMLLTMVIVLVCHTN
jgi:ankyrin repeat protein